MKRYWKIITILLVSTLTVGTFYLYTAFGKNGHPHYKITTLSGEEKEIESLQLLGSYSSHTLDDDFSLSIEGIDFESERSFISQMYGNNDNPEVKQLQKEYWNFTRGKLTNSVNYYSDDKYLAYSNMAHDWSFLNENNQFTFQISVLNKETNKTTSFDLNLPNGGSYNYVNTERVQMVGDELQVITRNSVEFLSEGEFHLYIFDIANKKLKSGERLFNIPKNESEDKGIDTFLLGEQTINRSNEYALFLQITTHYDQEAEEWVEEIAEEEIDEAFYEQDFKEDVTPSKTEDKTLFVYHFSTGKLATIDLPEQTYASDHFNLYDGTYLYFPIEDKQGTELLIYNLASEKIEQTHHFDKKFRALKVKDDKLYGIIQEDEKAIIDVFDLKTGASLYEGEAVLTSDTKLEEDDRINFYNIWFN